MNFILRKTLSLIVAMTMLITTVVGNTVFIGAQDLMESGVTYSFDLSSDKGNNCVIDSTVTGAAIELKERFTWHSLGGYNATPGNLFQFTVNTGVEGTYADTEIGFNFLKPNSAEGTVEIFDTENTSESLGSVTAAKAGNVALKFDAKEGHSYIVKGTSESLNWFLVTGINLTVGTLKTEDDSTTEATSETTTEGQGGSEDDKKMESGAVYSFDLSYDQGSDVTLKDSTGLVDLNLKSSATFPWHNMGGYDGRSGDWFTFTVDTGVDGTYEDTQLEFDFKHPTYAKGVAEIFDVEDTAYETSLGKVEATAAGNVTLKFDAENGHSYLVRGTGDSYSYFMIKGINLTLGAYAAPTMKAGVVYSFDLSTNKGNDVALSDTTGVAVIDLKSEASFPWHGMGGYDGRSGDWFSFSVPGENATYYDTEVGFEFLKPTSATGVAEVFDAEDTEYKTSLGKVEAAKNGNVTLKFDAQSGHTYVVRGTGSNYSYFLITGLTVKLGSNVWVDKTQTFRVGSSEKAQFKTVTEALNAIETAPTDEDERITIEIEPGTYREQLIINTPYLTLKKASDAAENEVVNITWYYGIGQVYANCGTGGVYDANVDWTAEETWAGLEKHSLGDVISAVTYYDKTGKLHSNESVEGGTLGKPKGWGSTMFLNGGAKYFNAEGIYFSNSFNLYICQEELDAKVTPEPAAGKQNRAILAVCTEETGETACTYDANKTDYTPEESAYLVRSKTLTERAAAINSSNSYMKIKNCTFSSNQDTMYIGGTGPVYFEDCVCIGNTDYIFGGAAAVFNNCELLFQGYTDQTGSGLVTAAATDSKNPYGYLFYNCTIGNVRENTTSRGSFGRPWGGINGPQVTFYNTTIRKDSKGQLTISDKAWNSMGCDPDEARFFEYNSVDENGNAVDTSQRVVNTVAKFGTVLDKWHALEYNPRNYLTAEWDPMNFGEKLTKVDEALKNVVINVPSGTETIITLPTPPEGIEYLWESSSVNAIVSEDGKTIKIMRPAYGEADIKTSISLYAMDTATEAGDRKDIDVTIAATTDSVNVFTVPMTITASAASEVDTDYTVKFEKEGALIKTATVTIPAGETTVTKDIDNIPATEGDGITYDVSIVSVSDDYTVNVPTDGKTTVTGVTGGSAPINVETLKLIDDEIEFEESYKNNGSKYSLDLIELAKAKGADKSIASSDIIKVKFNVTVNAKLTANSFIDLLSDTPASSCNLTGVATRYILTKLNSSWDQLDMVDSAQGFSGSSNGPDQSLKVTEHKFSAAGFPDSNNQVEIVINYKTNELYVNAGGKRWDFATMPSNYTKGNLFLAFYPGNSTDDFLVDDISVTYKKLIDDSEEPEEPDTRGDVNGDALIDVNDASLVLQYVLDKDNTVITEEGLANAEVSGDSEITAVDASKILQKALNSNFKY